MANTALDRGLEILTARNRFDAPTLKRLSSFLREAPEEALFRMSPLRFANEQGISERDAIDLFLYATHAGLLEFTWGVLCSACSAFLSTPAALRSLDNGRKCGLCNIDVPAHDDGLEVAFTVAPAVRRTRFHDPEKLNFLEDGFRLFFSPSNPVPQMFRDELRQRILWPDFLPSQGERSQTVTLEPGEYGLIFPELHAWSKIVVTPDAEPTDTVGFDVLDSQVFPAECAVRPGPVKVTVKSRSRQPVMFGLARAMQPHERPRDVKLLPYLSGKRLVTTQAFRELFRSESVPSGGGLEFKSLAVLFTDLKGSTEMYERIGDMRAYVLVRQHFDALREIIDRSGGSMVKTIGDAIMASFADVEPAMEAAVAMRSDIARIGGGELQLKIGLHAGPCIAVELNEQLDYFGQTVNVASRVQGLAAGREIVCTDPVWNADPVRKTVERAGLFATMDRAHLKGVDGEVTVHRLRTA